MRTFRKQCSRESAQTRDTGSKSHLIIFRVILHTRMINDHYFMVSFIAQTCLQQWLLCVLSWRNNWLVDDFFNRLLWTHLKLNLLIQFTAIPLECQRFKYRRRRRSLRGGVGEARKLRFSIYASFSSNWPSWSNFVWSCRVFTLISGFSIF